MRTHDRQSAQHDDVKRNRVWIGLGAVCLAVAVAAGLLTAWLSSNAGGEVVPDSGPAGRVALCALVLSAVCLIGWLGSARR